jgi:sec-independent protein translocase protein TatB
MLGPGIGGFEIVVIALVALIVVGPKDLPLLMRKIGQFMGRARKMAAEFRASFDDMARQSELDDLRKEVEALRSGQMDIIGKDTSAAFKEIDRDLKAPLKPSPASKAVVDKSEMTEIQLAKLDAEAAKPAASGDPEKPVEPKPAPPKAEAVEAEKPAPKAAASRKPKSEPTVATKARAARRKVEP